MNHISIKEAIQGILSKSMDADEAFVRLAPEHRGELAAHLAYVKERLAKGSTGAAAGSEILKTSKNGQWSLDKAIKPGPSLDYSKMNKKPDYADIEAKAPTINYSNTPGIKPQWSGAADNAKAVNAKLDAESKETAAQTIARRQGKKPVMKNEGTNLDAPAADKGRMTAKNEMMGGGPEGSPENAMQMSEAKYVEGSKEHEEEEKKKAKKIKDDAQDILDIHKADSARSSKSVPDMQEKGVQKADGVGMAGVTAVSIGGGKKRPVGSAVGEQAVRNE